ncbi:redoxin domain-containing protein [Fulvivirga sp. M361]|uniref:redoxin domain-containing protein n=1 Tax=Fulvivirga sp. M361 TaxID=2594266 RepID=UPI00117A1ED7|nr:redoxin domain-containing protein [Fulvivirga sp. M361]TRX57720.1 redoxin domain-containing protein [Fulvivirga sp. M361]
MKLTREIQAPLFNEIDIFDRKIDLNDYRDKKTLIAFFRHAGCPFCNLRVHNLMKISQELKDKGMEMIFFFESKKHILLRSTFHEEISPIPLIADPEKKWYDAYGLESSGYISAVSHITTFVQTAFKAYQEKVPMHMMADGESIKTIPAEFLVDHDLVIKKVHYSKSLADRIDIEEVRAFAD